MITYVQSSYSFAFLYWKERISRSKINKGADIGFPCLAPVLSLKYLVVNPPFITQDSDSWFLLEL